MKVFVAKCIKIMDSEFRICLEREFELQKECEHFNIAKVEELIYHELDFNAYIIMEYCEG